MDENDDIRQLLNSDNATAHDQRRTSKVLNRARRQVAQRDTMTFAFVKMWAALARLVAPFFAIVGEKQALAMQQQSPDEPTTNIKESH